MTTNRLENIEAQLTPGTDPGVGLASLATGIAPDGKTRATWEERNEDCGRPPWGWLLLGIVALSVVYWMWGQEAAGTRLRVSTPPQISALAMGLLPTLP
jgi:hypothetical protein